MSAAGTELDLVQSATGHLLVTAPGLLCKRGQLLGGQCCIRGSSWARAQTLRTSVRGDIIDIMYLVVYSRSGSSAAPGPFLQARSASRGHDAVAVLLRGQGGRNVQRLAWVTLINWVVCSRH